MLTDGYHEVPPGKLAAVVTSLQMFAPPARRNLGNAPGLALHRIEAPQPDRYRTLFKAVGEPWLWTSRLRLGDAALLAIIRNPAVEVFVLQREGREIGLLELDFRDTEACELAFFGVVPAAIGSGAGRYLMDRAIELAWTHPIRRFWVHTCTLDHPGALSFYLRSGFRPFRRQVEVFDDPRHIGVLEKAAAPDIPGL